MKARVVVTLKSGVLDPQGKAIEGALASLGIEGVSSVRQGKVFDIEIGGADPQRALELACEKLLANTVVESYRIETDAHAAPAATGSAPPPPSVAELTEIAAREAEMPSEGHP